VVRAWRGAIWRGLSGILSLVLLLGGIGALVIFRAGVSEAAGLPGAVDVSALSATELMDGAATKLQATTDAGGSGYRFEITQTSTMIAKAGGPRIPVPNPVTRGTLRMADTYFLNAILEQGVARPDGFWSQMRAGPAEGAKADWAGAKVMFEALVRDGQRWRNDGEGWYQAGALPGVGLDPETAALLPDLLRGGKNVADLPVGDAKVDPAAARTLGAQAKAVEIPGVVAADGAAFTKLTAPVAYGFDDTGRLVSVTVSALNTNMTEFDLVIETSIRIAYDGVAGLPEPKPVLKVEGSN
jgi:hypothetical protein